ncbi:Alpha/Beta hydrolase protein [Podospora fimiseda]|uniref:Alpha/Beta hydrolase protein n=1 Tax=Podospora fimiseda TaxID=252190 RepID=A0AAN7BL64_9PEZI|nr:Alpha/Beta hydrolase protein [Podospora fimiseda]
MPKMALFKKLILLSTSFFIVAFLHRLNLISLPSFLLRIPFLSGASDSEEEERIPPTHHFTLSDSRTIAYSIYNPSITSKTAFYFHGTPSSHHEAFLLASAAKRYRVRIIAPSRPGFGGSEFNENGTILSYADDIKQLADGLGVKRFAVIAVSGGAPFGFGCWKGISRNRIVGLAIVAGIYPVEGMNWSSRKVLLKVAGWWPGLVEWVIDRQVGGLEEDGIEEMMKSGGSEEEKKMWEEASEEMKKSVIMSVREGVRYGGKGAAWELKLLGGNWGFELEEVRPGRKGEVVLWHGDRDENVPVGMARLGRERLGELSELRVVEGQGHGTLTVYMAEEIVRSVGEMFER